MPPLFRTQVSLRRHKTLLLWIDSEKRILIKCKKICRFIWMPSFRMAKTCKKMSTKNKENFKNSWRWQMLKVLILNFSTSKVIKFKSIMKRCLRRVAMLQIRERISRVLSLWGFRKRTGCWLVKNQTKCLRSLKIVKNSLSKIKNTGNSSKSRLNFSDMILISESTP